MIVWLRYHHPFRSSPGVLSPDHLIGVGISRYRQRDFYDRGRIVVADVIILGKQLMAVQPRECLDRQARHAGAWSRIIAKLRKRGIRYACVTL